MYEGKQLFNVNHSETGKYDCFIHAAKIQAKIGPPRQGYEIRCPAAKGFFRKDVMLLKLNELNLIENTTLEESEMRSQGKDQEVFLDLMRSMLRGLPEERKTPTELLCHPWLILSADG